MAADAPALILLHLSGAICAPGPALSDAILGPVLRALPRNTHLRCLSIFHCRPSAELERDVLLPAVQGNASLRILDWYHRLLENTTPGAAATEALRLVNSRAWSD